MLALLTLGLCVAGAASAVFVGRFTQKGQAEWPLSSIRVVIERNSPGSTVQLSFDCTGGGCNYYVDISVNCGEFTTTKAILVSTEVSTIDLDDALGGSAKNVNLLELEIIKVTETNTESSVWGSLLLADITGAKSVKGATSCLKPRSHKILVFGDSLSCGYGVLGQSPCPFTGETESARLAWAALVAEAVNAEINLVCWSGKGVVRNYGEKTTTSPQPLPAFYNSTLGSMVGDPANYWDPHFYSPDLVMIYLGANDYSTDPHPTDEEFVGGYQRFVAQIKSDYPFSRILLITDEFSMANSNIKAKNVEKVAGLTQSLFYQFPLSTVPDGDSWGCNGHPNVDMQRNMASTVTPVVAAALSANGDK